MPFPSRIDFNTVHNATTGPRAAPISGDGVLTHSEMERLWTAFTTANGFTDTSHHIPAFDAFLADLANSGFARLYDPGDKLLTIESVSQTGARTERSGAKLKHVIGALLRSVPRYTHQRLSRSSIRQADGTTMSVADLTADSLRTLAQGPTDWATNNGLAGLVEDRFGFPAAVRCTGISVEDKLRITAASSQALGTQKAEMINYGMEAARKAIDSQGLVSVQPRLQIEL